MSVFDKSKLKTVDCTEFLNTVDELTLFIIFCDYCNILWQFTQLGYKKRSDVRTEQLLQQKLASKKAMEYSHLKIQTLKEKKEVGAGDTLSLFPWLPNSFLSFIGDAICCEQRMKITLKKIFSRQWKN